MQGTGNSCRKKSVDDIPLLIEKKSACVQWRIQPVADIALTSVQSGKAVTPAAEVKAGSVIEQVEWKNQDAQLWNFMHVENGFYSVQSKANPKLCLAVINKSIVPGTGVELGECGEVHAQCKWIS